MNPDTILKMPYSKEQFLADAQRLKPRVFDTYILPLFLAGYAIKSKEMGKTARRILFISGVYMTYRNIAEYRKSYSALKDFVSSGKSVKSEVETAIV